MIYTASQKHESTLLHTYVLKEFLTADHSHNIFEKTLVEVGSSHLYASFGTFCYRKTQPEKFAFPPCMFENRQIAAIEAKHCQIWNSSECLKTRRASNN